MESLDIADGLIAWAWLLQHPTRSFIKNRWNKMASLDIEAGRWKDNEEYAVDIRDRFDEYVQADAELDAHRTYTGPRGMGERCFHWLWKLLVDALPPTFNFLEVGVFKGQILSLVRFLAARSSRNADIYGVTMLSTFAGSRPPHPEGDYLAAIQEMHTHFAQPMPILIVGDSTSQEVHDKVAPLAPFNMIFIDGCHDYEYVACDLTFYAPRISIGGFLVIDDAANGLNQPWGFFQGIESVTRAVRTVILTNPQWQHVITVCHDRVFRRIK